MRAAARAPVVTGGLRAGPGVKANLWKRSWRDKILPAVVNFAPDLILISAGAHLFFFSFSNMLFCLFMLGVARFQRYCCNGVHGCGC